MLSLTRRSRLECPSARKELSRLWIYACLSTRDLAKLFYEELMFITAFSGNGAPYFRIGMGPPYKMLSGTETDLRSLRVIGARVVVHMETSQKTRAQGNSKNYLYESRRAETMFSWR